MDFASHPSRVAGRRLAKGVVLPRQLGARRQADWRLQLLGGTDCQGPRALAPHHRAARKAHRVELVQSTPTSQGPPVVLLRQLAALSGEWRAPADAVRAQEDPR